MYKYIVYCDSGALEDSLGVSNHFGKFPPKKRPIQHAQEHRREKTVSASSDKTKKVYSEQQAHHTKPTYNFHRPRQLTTSTWQCCSPSGDKHLLVFHAFMHVERVRMNARRRKRSGKYIDTCYIFSTTTTQMNKEGGCHTSRVK